MQSNLTQLQYQQLQIQQQQQRLANMMQQKQRGYPQPQPWDEGMNFNKQQQLFQMQQQQQRMLNNQQKELQQQQHMMRPQSIPQPNTMLPPAIPQHLQQQQQQMQIQQPIVPVITPATTNSNNTNAIKVKTETQKKNLQQYEYRDESYQDTLNLQHKRHIELAHTKKRSIEMASLERRNRMQPGGPIITFGPGYRGYGNGKTGTRSRIRFPQEKKRKREFRFPAEAIKEQAKKEDTLVPIRIDLEHEGYKLRDTFTWNLNESLITPEQFADIMCEDLKLPHGIFMDQIAKAIKEQIDDYNLNASSMMKEETEESVEQKSETLNTLSQDNSSGDIITNLSNGNSKGIELRTVIKLDITVGNRELVDQFEWDISCPRNSPEEFANTLTTELGLGGEFKTAIAHSIREQIHVYIKSLLLVGYEFNNSSTIDDEIRHNFLPRLQTIVRDNTVIERFTPSITELSDAAIEKMEKDRMREARRKRRGTRARRGIILPDREPQKTHRTGFAVPPEQELTDEQFLNGQGMYDQPGTHNKRSAALKARMNIAAEAADTGDDIHGGASGNMQGVISLGNMNKFTSMNEHQKYAKHHHVKLDPTNLTNIDTATVCGPYDPVLLYVHCSSNKPDPHVRIRRQTTPNRIPPVIIVTGIKKEGRLPKIFDERPDTSVKIIVLDLRGSNDPNNVNENQPASKFKKMPLEIWENVLQIGRAYKPNQPTECPIQTSTPTIDIYSNILPTNNNPPTPTPQQQQLVPHNPMMFNTGMFPPHMMYGNNNAFMMGQQPLLYNQPNYVNVMAAAQSIVNAAAAYNNMYNPTFNQPTAQQQQQLLSPQPHPQQILSPQQQHQQQQIKRKPVQLQPTQYISPQIEQRLLRKKTIPQQQVPPQVQQPPPRIKKSVRFADKPIIHTYEALEEEYNPEEEVQEEVDDQHQQGGDGYYDEDDGYYDQQQHYYPEDEVEQHRHHRNHHDAYYTQQPPPYNNYSSNSSNGYPPITRPWSANSGRQYYYDNEEDHGELWKRRNFITRHNSMGGSSGGSSNKPRV